MLVQCVTKEFQNSDKCTVTGEDRQSRVCDMYY